MNLWQELRRRRVFRLAGFYVVGAWLVIQVADISFPAWGLPETALRFLFIAAIAGFPIALIFGWFYDVTPQGIVRTEAAGEAEAVDLRLKPADYVVLAALLTVGAAIVIGSLGKIQEEVETATGAAAETPHLSSRSFTRFAASMTVSELRFSAIASRSAMSRFLRYLPDGS